MHLNDTVALVTGAGSGIGKAAALHLAAHGAKVAALGRTEDELNQTVEAIKKAGGEALGIVADISDPDEMQKAVDQTLKQWGKLNCVFANAGINGVWAPIEELKLEEWQKTLDINLTGTFLTIQKSVPALKKQGGSIIVTSSINGTRTFSNAGATAYSTTKAGQVAMSKMLALELGQFNIRVNVICPGAIETSIEESTEKRSIERVQVPAEFPEGDIPLTHGKPGTSEQVAQLVGFLASEASSHITGTEIWIDGGQSLLRG
ncbi:SDR family oxidoreductase [Herpetosiphon geysericola]|uniref:3-ketoacyl-ACP reductase n=1 Tax=Herpetosiphon geysericola TaxID=70996 RepID=A0A0P6XYS6_9CHLR|nr:SDR family NAD(P)-dependent oxidoreductase [Herpetosiphon geysericola]KPL81551.1 3-ketoacyl-ACP reductase [Herpetosiphon geysericola]